MTQRFDTVFENRMQNEPVPVGTDDKTRAAKVMLRLALAMLEDER